jgi:hypothetical protein
VGDAGIPVAVYVRVAMLACAVAVGVAILREYLGGRNEVRRAT